ncbi:Hypothetical protein, putative [Bodo saltans]|uniref:Uncharacterized protein n=1 Tax=Bodo saltans TaxID=75058 RepID=A0A0S4JE32_BODSA|nr:Hypothetical protein, putative [Bodo saltans]|eukprot:CUG88299.1 Hypothetical protein, putative [Bodo saltans]
MYSSSPGISSRSSASRVRHLMTTPNMSHVDPTPSRIEFDVDRTTNVAATSWPMGPNSIVRDDMLGRGAQRLHNDPVQPPQAWEEERNELVLKLASMESTKEKEVDHLRVRVAQLTKRVAELEASLATVHRALEEEAATAIGLQRNTDAMRSRFVLTRWREKLTVRRLRRESQANATLTSAINMMREEERSELVLKLASMESTKEKEVDHLRVRVAQLTKRVAELEASLATVHRALEEEAATAIGLQRNTDAMRSRFVLTRWREKLTVRRLRRESQANATLTSAINDALTILPTAAGGNSAPLMRKALEELAWCERQWADQRLDHLRQSSQAFRGLAQRQSSTSLSPTTIASSPRSPSFASGDGADASLADQQALASTISSARVLLERADGIAAAKFQVLLQSFQSYARCDKVQKLLEEGARRAATILAPSATTPHAPPVMTSSLAEDPETPPSTRRPQPAPMPSLELDEEKHVLLRSMRYDVLRDTIHSIVTVVILPPALQMLEDAVQHHPVLAKLMEGLDELLMQHPLSLQVERCLQTCFSKHFRLHGNVDAAGGKLVDGKRLPHGAHVATATFVVEEPPTMGGRGAPRLDAASARQVLHSQPLPSSDDATLTRKQATPVQTKRALRWDLVHSILEDPTAPSLHPRSTSTPRVTQALRRHTTEVLEPHSSGGEQMEDSTMGRLEHARRSLRQSHRSSAL